ncbi:hypothetical protein GLX27_000144 [Malassezia furfur]|uniref:Uncharacterized protein n=1 Tax=Malassezia furfur TaxID=55194 RepID=A0ABY8EI96_MALFU|nr:hypothetical protein GLX27_000144 [Malassezia furfur]
MSGATWRNYFSYSRYTAIAAKATRNSLKEAERVAAERRSQQALRYQTWKNGEASEQNNLGYGKKN